MVGKGNIFDALTLSSSGVKAVYAHRLYGVSVRVGSQAVVARGNKNCAALSTNPFTIDSNRSSPLNDGLLMTQPQPLVSLPTDSMNMLPEWFGAIANRWLQVLGSGIFPSTRYIRWDTS